MDEPKKVYIVTSGEYSGYGIDCVFSDEDEANAYVARWNQVERYMHYQVEEYVLDAARPVDRSGLVAFQVSYSIGWQYRMMSISFSPWNCYGDAEKSTLPFEHVHHEDSLHVGSGEVSHRWETWVWAKDKDDALRIGADKITPVLAEMQIEGVEPPKLDPLELDTPFLTALGGPPVMGDYTRKVEWGVKDGE